MNHRLGLLITYCVYLFTILGMLYTFLAPKVANALFWKEAEAKQITIEVIKVGYQLDQEVPQEVINSLIEKYTNPEDTYLGYNKRYAMRRIIWCESWNTNLQSLVIKNGIQENSWGVAQIHLDSHTDIAKEQALDVEFSVKFMAENLGKVAWYGWNPKLDKCN